MKNLNLVETTVLVAGQKVHFVELNLRQKFYKHHRCSILVDHDAFGDKKWLENPVKIFKLIGESINITMTHRDTGESNVFSGLVSNISFVGGNGGAQNYILVEGVSDTIRLEGKPTMNSFTDKSLKEIIAETVSSSGNGASVTVQPEYTKPIYYIEQHNETCFDFLNRLCYLFGESFWSDGSATYWGKPEPQEPLVLKYGVEMTDYNLRGSLLPPKFQHYDYLVTDDEERDKQTRKPVPEASGYLQPILDKSEQIYTSDAISPLNPLVGDTDSILKMVDIERTRTVADMLVLSGKTQTCKIGLGKIIIIEFPSYMEITTSEGEFIITELNHSIDQEGHYSNTFSATRAALTYIPMPPVKLPIATPQRATVLSNADPENKGRIKVQTQWQKLIGKESNWIRVQTPDAGGSDKVGSNRGLVTIPEEGDMVMINYEYGDPNRPYSSGSLFTSKNGGGGGQGNKTKSLTTRSGCTMTLDDDKGSATLKDPSGNIIELDGAGNITITAPEKITLNTKEIHLNGQMLIQLQSEKMISGQCLEKIELGAQQDILIHGETKVRTQSPTLIEEEAPKITSTGTTQVEINGGTSVDISGTMTNIKGTPLNLN